MSFKLKKSGSSGKILHQLEDGPPDSKTSVTTQYKPTTAATKTKRRSFNIEINLPSSQQARPDSSTAGKSAAAGTGQTGNVGQTIK